KKMLIADQLAVFVDPVFDAAGYEFALTIYEAWIGGITYAFQIYFDFSGYTDMALGLGLIFGIRLPINFFSPYKSRNISDFWGTWHITLSRFFREYLYFPLGGNRKGVGKTLLNLVVTMLLGGLWHGANWKFVVWGGLHGIYLASYHTWKNIIPSKNRYAEVCLKPLSIGLTFCTVTIAWVFFRADSIEVAMKMVGSMLGLNGLFLPMCLNEYLGGPPELYGAVFNSGVIGNPIRCISWIFFLSLIIFLLPNSVQIASYYRRGYGEKKSTQLFRTGVDQGAVSGDLFWRFGMVTLPFIAAIIICVAIMMFELPESTPFIYMIF
ncbi:MAG: MBOAT family protein, partial [Candidatus Electrothrix sp. AR1]|nr:MBOAT family protein [Candidatus Electrothrix sp. AR1]